MSQIDKAFLSVYSKKRPNAPSSTEVRPLVDPMGERLLKIHAHASNAELMQPHVAAPVAVASVVTALRGDHFLETLDGVPLAMPVPAPQLPNKGEDTGIASGTRTESFKKSQSLRAAHPEYSAPHQPAVALPSQSKTATKPIEYPVPPSSPSNATDIDIEPAYRKTLTSYLQQARQSTAPSPSPALPTRWTVSSPPSQIAKDRPVAEPASTRQSKPSVPVQQHRVDAPHTINPPIPRPEATIPWSFGTVERSIKATADSKSVAARTSNQPKPVPFAKKLSAEHLAKMTMPIQPVWEIDEFLWPSATASLLSTQAESFHEIGLHLQHAQSKGLRVLSVASGERGVGRSTVAMCLAKTMSIMGMRIALVDGDYECPSLVDQLNLEVQHGWQQCLLENVPLDEVAVHAVDEAITLFPLTDSIAASQVAKHTIRINKLIKRIANAYDMVIIDANRLTQKQCQLLGTGDEAVLDAALLIIDVELSLRQRVDAAIDLVKQQGVQSIGLVENFHS